MLKNRYLDLAYVYFVRDFNDLAKDKTYISLHWLFN